MTSISGRITSTCGLLVKSTQTRIGSLPYFAPMTVLASITDPLVEMAVDVVDAMGLAGVFVLMLAESACIPIPSEATMLFAGFNVSNGEYSLLAATAVGSFGEPRRLLDRVLGRLRRPRRPAREARQQAAHQEEPPRLGRSLVRAPRRRHRVLRADAADHPNVHLAAGRRGADALPALQPVHACRLHPMGADADVHRQAGRRQLGELEGQPPLRGLRGDRRAS